MNAAVAKVVRWSFIGGFIAFGIDWAVSGGQPLGTRIMVGIMCFGAGFVTGGMIAANFSADHPDTPGAPGGGHGAGHGGGSHGHGAPHAPPTPPAPPASH
ncbi:MAG: hypothetical protein JNL90_03570 [Planctomycetes bacterium]|nr:hypothetical protein [Planctomycetota bacterium]